jgi:hypothetical protein
MDTIGCHKTVRFWLMANMMPLFLVLALRNAS